MLFSATGLAELWAVVVSGGGMMFIGGAVGEGSEGTGFNRVTNKPVSEV